MTWLEAANQFLSHPISGLETIWQQAGQISSPVDGIDNTIFGTLSNDQRRLIDAGAISGINQAAAGNSALAGSEIRQYQNDVNNAVYSGLPTTLESYTASIEKWLPWIAGGLVIIYFGPAIARTLR